MDFTIPATAITNLSAMAEGVGTGTITNIGAMAGLLGLAIVVLFSRGLIFKVLSKFGI